MSVITAVNSPPISGDGVASFVWTLATSDTAGAVNSPGNGDRSVQITGTFNGATVALQGSNDGTNFVTLTDPLGAAVAFTAAGLKQVSELTRYIKPVVTSGTVTAVVVTMAQRNR